MTHRTNHAARFQAHGCTLTGVLAAPSGAAPPPDDPFVTESQPAPEGDGQELVARPDEYTVVVNDELHIAAPHGVLKNDTYDSSAYVADTYADDDPRVEFFAVFADGSFTFKANTTGEIRLPYKLFSSDAQRSATGEITMHVIPDAADHRFETPKDQALEVGPSGVLRNARVSPGGSVTLTWVEPGIENGSVVSWDADGSFTFVPDPGYVGSVEFSYELTDNNGMVASGWVTLDVVEPGTDDDGGPDPEDDGSEGNAEMPDEGDARNEGGRDDGNRESEATDDTDGDSEENPPLTRDRRVEDNRSEPETKAPTRKETPTYTG